MVLNMIRGLLLNYPLPCILCAHLLLICRCYWRGYLCWRASKDHFEHPRPWKHGPQNYHIWPQVKFTTFLLLLCSPHSIIMEVMTWFPWILYNAQQPLIISAWNDLAGSDYDRLSNWVAKFSVVDFTAWKSQLTKVHLPFLPWLVQVWVWNMIYLTCPLLQGFRLHQPCPQ